MNYTLIGTGNMAYYLSGKLQKAGWVCNGVWGRNIEAASSLARELHTVEIPSLQDISDENNACVLITVSDHAIAEVSEQLNIEKSVAIHTAGSISLEALPQNNKAVLWPIYSILKNDLPLDSNLPIICEANNEVAKQVVLKMAKAISQNLEFTSFQTRRRMHLIAAFANNFTNHTLAIAEQLSEENHIDFDLFQPIIQQTFERIKANGAYNSQSGAAKRNDEETMQQHISLLAQHPSWEKVYKAISDSIKDLYSHKGK